MDELKDTSKFTMDPEEQIIIKAIGVGGGGNNAVDHMFRQGIKNVSFVNINTDAQALRNSVVTEKLVIGNGLGAGNDPEKARAFAEESADEIAQLFCDSTQMVFITAGMGGGTGTGAAPVVARIAREHNLLTIGIVTIPFVFEGSKKIFKALAGADEMAKYVDALLLINNERLTEIYPDLDFLSGFAKADDTLSMAARSISELITSNGMVNLDFNDVDTTLRKGGSAIISTGYGEGDQRVTKAIEDALNSPLLRNCNILGSKKLLFNIYYSREAENSFKMEEVNELKDFVSTLNDSIDVIWGVSFDETLGEKIKITVLAAGFDMALEEEVDDNKPRRSGSFFDKKPKSKPETPKPDEGSRRLIEEYGSDNILDKNNSRYIIMQPDQLDDDSVIDIVESTVTASRDKKMVEKARNLSARIATDDNRSAGAQTPKDSSRIEF